jgi:hypothetical protein
LEILRGEGEEVAREYMFWISEGEKWRTRRETAAEVSHWCQGIGVLRDSGRLVSKSAGVWVGHGCDGTGRYQSYLCCGKARTFEIMEGSGDEASMSPAAKESKRWGSKIGVKLGRGAFLSMALLIKDQSLAN